MEPGRNQAQGLKSRGRIKYEKVCGLPFFDAIAVLNAQRSGGVSSDEIEHAVDLFVAAHMAEEEGELGGGQHIASAQREPGIHDRVMPQRDVDACLQQFLDARDAAPLRVGIEATLKHDVIEGVGDDVSLRTRKQ